MELLNPDSETLNRHKKQNIFRTPRLWISSFYRIKQKEVSAVLS